MKKVMISDKSVSIVILESKPSSDGSGTAGTAAKLLIGESAENDSWGLVLIGWSAANDSWGLEKGFENDWGMNESLWGSVMSLFVWK